MTTEQENYVNPVYIVEEEDDEEELVTIDFNEKTIYQKEEHLYTREIDEEPTKKLGLMIEDAPAELVQAPKPSFESDIQDLFLNSMTSKAIGSLLKKHGELDKEIDLLMNKQRMGEMQGLLYGDIDKAMYKRRMELRACYNGSTVRYENIPEWAKSYVRDYVKNMVLGLSQLTEDGE